MKTNNILYASSRPWLDVDRHLEVARCKLSLWMRWRSLVHIENNGSRQFFSLGFSLLTCSPVFTRCVLNSELGVNGVVTLQHKWADLSQSIVQKQMMRQVLLLCEGKRRKTEYLLWERMRRGYCRREWTKWSQDGCMSYNLSHMSYRLPLPETLFFSVFPVLLLFAHSKYSGHS